MELQDILLTVSGICISHKQIDFFDYGEEFLADTVKKNKHSNISFLEIPYSIQYESTSKTIRFALLILMNSKFDNVVEDHVSISNAESIGESIIANLKDQEKTLGFFIKTVDGVSLREFTDERYNGMRFEITGKVNKSFCNKNYQDEFESA